MISGVSGIGGGCKNQDEKYNEFFQDATIPLTKLSIIVADRYQKLNYTSEVDKPF